MEFPLTNRAGTLYRWLPFDIAKVRTCIYAMRNVILFGNGLNRLNKKNVSWSGIYPIHGDISYPKSIVIDYNHYCGTLGKISDYLKGHYEWKDKPLPKMEKRVMEVEWTDMTLSQLGDVVEYVADNYGMRTAQNVYDKIDKSS